MQGFNDYIGRLLGKGGAKVLRGALKGGSVVVVGGPRGSTGKTTLVEVLRRKGHRAFEFGEFRILDVECDTDTLYFVKLVKPLQKIIPNLAEQISFCGSGKVGSKLLDLNDVSTADLVSEISGRTSVFAISAGPYEKHRLVRTYEPCRYKEIVADTVLVVHPEKWSN